MGGSFTNLVNSYANKSTASGSSGSGTSFKDLTSGATGPHTAKTVAHKGGGGVLGFLGGVAHGAAMPFEDAGHAVADFGAHAAQDISGIAGGAWDVLKNAPQADFHDFTTMASHGGNLPKGYKNPNWGPQQKAEFNLLTDPQAPLNAAWNHPLRDPFLTLTVLAAPLLHLSGEAGFRGAAAVDAVRRGESVGRAFASKPELPARSLVQAGGERVFLHGSRNPGLRALEILHDKIVQKAMDEMPGSKLAKYGALRMRGGLAMDRFSQRMRAAISQDLRGSVKDVTREMRKSGVKDELGSRRNAMKVAMTALRATSENGIPEERAAAHLELAKNDQVAGLDSSRNEEWARNYANVARLEMTRPASEEDVAAGRALHVGDTAINADRYPELAKLDQKILAHSTKVDELLVRHGFMTEEGQRNRINAPNEVYRTGEPLNVAARRAQPEWKAAVANAHPEMRDSLYQAMQEHLGEAEAQDFIRYLDERTSQWEKNGGSPQEPYNAIVAGIEHAQTDPVPAEEAHGEFERLLHPGSSSGEPSAQEEEAAAATGEHSVGAAGERRGGLGQSGATSGGLEPREGRNYTPYRTSEPTRRTKAAPSATAPPIGGEAKNPVSAQEFRGTGILHGNIPDNLVRDLTDSWNRALKGVFTAEQRDAAVKTGSYFKRSERDFLVRIRGEKAGKLPLDLEEAIGRRRSTLDSLPGDTFDHEIGTLAGMKAWLEDAIPSFGDQRQQEWEAAHAIGAKAPDGFKWVDRGVFGNPNRFIPANYEGIIGHLVRAVDTMNAAITAATVYYKLGHVGTRFGTNMMTNLIQGSLNPRQIPYAITIWHELNGSERTAAVNAAGTHYFSSLPQEGDNYVGRAARYGANIWAKRADQMFRFNSITFEARKAGFEGVDGFREFLHKLEDPHNLSPEEAHRIREIAERADREAIAYDRLNEGEKNVLARAIWFYPWLKGSAVFAKDTLFEHPFKSAILGALGHQGAQAQQKELGSLPSYERGLFEIGGPNKQGMPLVADFSTFSPFSTASDLAQLASGTGSPASSFFNPMYGAIIRGAEGQNSYGTPIKNPGLGSDLKNFLAQILSPTPEYQIGQAISARNQDQSNRMFPTNQGPLPSWLGGEELLRFLLGPGTPRRINLARAHTDAAREKKGG